MANRIRQGEKYRGIESESEYVRWKIDLPKRFVRHVLPLVPLQQKEIAESASFAELLHAGCR